MKPALVVERWRWSFDGHKFSVRILDIHHPRASVDEIRDHVEDFPNKPDEWYMAQMCHYGRFPAVPPLPLSLNKKNLKEAVTHGQLVVPESLVQLEHELAGEWAAAAEAGKTGTQKMDTLEDDSNHDGGSLMAEGLEIAARLLKKPEQELHGVYTDEHASAEEPEVASSNVLFPVTSPREGRNLIKNEPSQFGIAPLATYMTLPKPGNGGGSLLKAGSSLAGPSQNRQFPPLSGNEDGWDTEVSSGPGAITSPPKALPAVSASSEVISISSDDDADCVIELTSEMNDGSDDVHVSSKKDWRRGHSNRKRARHDRGMTRPPSVLAVRGDQPSQQVSQTAPRTFAPLGNLSGVYRVLCSGISAYGQDPCTLHMILTTTGNIIRGAFDFGPIHGYIRTDRLPLATCVRRIPFQWRGIDDTNRVFNREEDGSCLMFFGNGGICGTLCWPNVKQKFEAVMLSSSEDENEEAHGGKDEFNAAWIDEYWEKLNTAAMK